MELVKEQGKGRHVGGPVLSGEHTHMGRRQLLRHCHRASFLLQEKRLFHNPWKRRKWKVPQHHKSSPLRRAFCFSRSGAELARKPITQRVPLRVCSLVQGTGRLSRGFSEKQLSSDPAGSTFLHDEGGISVFTLNNVFLCLNRTHYVLNSSRFLAPHCSSSRTETGLRPLAEARANAGLV